MRFLAITSECNVARYPGLSLFSADVLYGFLTWWF